jgi:quercetin dioxygenase-like cupin family protein
MTIKLISIFVVLSFTLSIFLFTSKLWSQETPQISVPIPMIFPLGEPNDAYAQYFTGKSYLKMLTTEGVNIANVTFEPKCRNFWHIHHKGGQILLVTAGRGYYQEYGKNAQELHPGDVVNVKPGVKHWHGAAKDSWFSHLSVEIPAPGASNEWLEPVSNEEYDKLK